MYSRGYAVLLWNNNTLMGIYTVVRSMNEAEEICERLVENGASLECDSVSWMPTFIKDE